MTITYTRPVYDQFDNNKLLKKRAASKQMGATSYSTVRLLDYLDEIQKMRDSPHYMFGRHSLTPWYSNNFIDSMSISIYEIRCFRILRPLFPFYWCFKILMKTSLWIDLLLSLTFKKFLFKSKIATFHEASFLFILLKVPLVNDLNEKTITLGSRLIIGFWCRIEPFDLNWVLVVYCLKNGTICNIFKSVFNYRLMGDIDWAFEPEFKINLSN